MRAQNQRNNADEAFMRLAIAEAEKGAGRTSPNPAVGAVIVRGAKVLARGYHRAAGCPHAEVEALGRTANARGATLYVTLEPCSTQGRTPPCTDAILNAGITRVVVGAVDPNPRHAGHGLKLLEGKGVTVTRGVLAEECGDLNPAFNKWIVTGMPWVIAKAATTLDGRLSLPPADGQWLSGRAARAHAHSLRARVDAILIGAETLRADNPRLTVRGTAKASRQPWRVVLAGREPLPGDAHLFTDAHRERTLAYINQALVDVLRDLGKRQVTSVLIEGGGQILGSAFDADLVDEVEIYLTPRIAAGPVGAVGGKGRIARTIHRPRFTKIGRDVVLQGRMHAS